MGRRQWRSGRGRSSPTLIPDLGWLGEAIGALVTRRALRAQALHPLPACATSVEVQAQLLGNGSAQDDAQQLIVARAWVQGHRPAPAGTRRRTCGPARGFANS